MSLTGSKIDLWQREGAVWPNRTYSQFIQAADLCWHVQILGRGPVLLLVHGTGAATHSWRGMAPLLAECFTVVAPDLPGHGFTELPPQKDLSLPAMARSLSALLQTLDLAPQIAIGHSAGAAILARASLEAWLRPDLLVSLNGALLPLRGLTGSLFSPMARLLATGSLAAKLFAHRARDRKAVQRLIDSTGSRLEPDGVDYYWRLVREPSHVAGALGMMAQWDLRVLARTLPLLEAELILVVGDHDLTVSPTEAQRVLERVPTAKLIILPGLGHLAHEEKPEQLAELIIDQAKYAELVTT